VEEVVFFFDGRFGVDISFPSIPRAIVYDKTREYT
jgi:hypothetical protein